MRLRPVLVIVLTCMVMLGSLAGMLALVAGMTTGERRIGGLQNSNMAGQSKATMSKGSKGKGRRRHHAAPVHSSAKHQGHIGSGRNAASVDEAANARETGWDVLESQEGEVEGYGLYSYLLFGAPPTPATRPLYLQAVNSCIEQIPYIDDLNVPLSELNILYLPTKDLLTEDLLQGPRIVLANWILKNYDYPRARLLLRNVMRSHQTGPYIVSLQTPLSQQTAHVTQYLFQDMSRCSPDLAVLWIQLFRDRAMQDQFWKETGAQSVKEFVIEMRQAIADAADGVATILPAYKRVRSIMGKLLFSRP